MHIYKTMMGSIFPLGSAVIKLVDIALSTIAYSKQHCANVFDDKHICAMLLRISNPVSLCTTIAYDRQHCTNVFVS